MTSAIQLHSAQLSYGNRTLWENLDLEVFPGDFLAVLGPNGSGKTSLLKVLLGQQALTHGTAKINGHSVNHKSHSIGYIPQLKTVNSSLSLRGTDLVGLGLDGHRWGTVSLRNRKQRQQRIADAVASVGAQSYAHLPIGLLSGGEQQRLRVAQALVSNPSILLCDEPLLSLDLAHQELVSQLIGQQAKEYGATVLFVTHEINSVLRHVDRVLYVVNGRFRIGSPAEVMTSETLSELYQARVDVRHFAERIVVVGADGSEQLTQYHHFPEPAGEHQ